MVFVPNVAVITALVVVVTVVVLTVNDTVFAPAGTVTVAGTVANAEFDERLIVHPPAGAEPPSVSVQVEEDPPVTDVGLNVTLWIRGTFT